MSLRVRNASFVYPADFDNDGDCDLALGSQATSSINILFQNHLLWDKTSFTMYAADAGITLNPGNPKTHRDEAWFTSTHIIQTTRSPDSIAVIDSVGVDYTTTWKGSKSPSRAAVEVWVSATSEQGSGKWSEWVKVTGLNQKNLSGRVFRYRLCFKTGLETALSLREVRFFFSIHRNVGFNIIWNGGRDYDIWLGVFQTLGSQSLPSVYDETGRRVRTLNPDSFGYIHWSGEDENGNRLPAGVYFLSLRQGSLTQSRKLILLP